jgi:hypothetical protein
LSVVATSEISEEPFNWTRIESNVASISSAC